MTAHKRMLTLYLWFYENNEMTTSGRDCKYVQCIIFCFLGVLNFKKWNLWESLNVVRYRFVKYQRKILHIPVTNLYCCFSASLLVSLSSTHKK